MSLIRNAPAWLLSHPWTFAGLVVLGMAAFTALILLNPEGRQVRERFRRRR